MKIRVFLLWLLAAAIFAIFLTGCTNKENSYELAPEYGIMEDIYLTAESSEYGRDVKEIVCLLENKSDELFGYGEKFALEKNVGGVWRTVPYKDWAEFVLYAILLQPSESTTHTFYLDKYYELPLTDGLYRIRLDTELPDMVYAEFTVK